MEFSRKRASKMALKVKIALVVILVFVLSISIMSVFIISNVRESLEAQMTKNGFDVIYSLESQAKQLEVIEEELLRVFDDRIYAISSSLGIADMGTMTNEKVKMLMEQTEAAEINIVDSNRKIVFSGGD